MKIEIKDFQVEPGKKVNLKRWPTKVKPVYKSKQHYQELMDGHVEELSDLQRLLYATDRHALLLIFQGMDAAGKDGAIRHVLSGVNPQGCMVSSFKQPSSEERMHDFLWRTSKRLPNRGMIGIFNRSYYEDVLVVRVHPEILESVGITAKESNEDFWKERYRSITEHERHLHHNRTRIVKFYLHLSKDEQKSRFLERIDNPDKNWKFTAADAHERTHWDEYAKVYGACLEKTTTDHAPWYVVPADDKKNARLIISEIVLHTLRAMDMEYPKTTPQRHEELLEIKKAL
jgi:PPK2 family polyphosphate:nucleotide phosphotransferase